MRFVQSAKCSIACTVEVHGLLLQISKGNFATRDFVPDFQLQAFAHRMNGAHNSRGGLAARLCYLKNNDACR